MPQQASGQGGPVTINVDSAWHDGEKQPLVTIQMNDMGCAIPPEGAIQLGLRMVEVAHISLFEGHMRAFLAAQGLDQIQVLTALQSFRALVKARNKARAERPMSVFMHDERVEAANGDAQAAFASECPVCHVPQGMCNQEVS